MVYKTGKEVISAFWGAYLEERDLEKTVSYLTEDIHWLETSQEKVIRNIAAAKKWIEAAIAKDQSGFKINLKIESEQIINDAVQIIGAAVSAKHYESLSTLNFSVMGVCRREGETYKICSLQTAAKNVCPEGAAVPSLAMKEDKMSAMREKILDENVAGGMTGIFIEPEMTVAFINQSMLDYLGYTQEAFFAYTGGRFRSVIYPDDLEIVEERFIENSRQGDYFEAEYRLIRSDGSYIWISEKGLAGVDENTQKPILFSLYFDITKEKENELELRISDERFQIAIEQSDAYIWEYDIKGKEKNSEILIISNNHMEHFEESYDVHPDSLKTIEEMHRQISEGCHKVGGEIRVKTESEEYEWFQINYTTIFDAKGEPYKALGVSKNLTEQKKIEEQYHREFTYRKAIEKILVDSTRMNLTTNRIEDFYSKVEIPEGIAAAVTCEDMFGAIAELIPEENERNTFIECFTLENLQQKFEAGETYFIVEYRRRFKNGEVNWVKTNVRMIRDPQSYDLIVFLYARNINEPVLTKKMLKEMVETNYEFACCLDIVHDTALVYCGNEEKLAELPEKNTPWQRQFKTYIEKNVRKEDLKKSVEEVSLFQIARGLEQNGCYTTWFEKKETHGDKKFRQIQFTYLEKIQRLVLMLCQDITEAEALMLGSERERQLPPRLKEKGPALNEENLKALIIDDDEIICKQVQNVLLELNIPSQWTNSSTKGIDIIERMMETGEKPFDMIFLDLSIPEMNGLEAAKALNSVMDPKSIIVMMTSYDWEDIEAEAFKRGVGSFVSKPVFRESLEAAIYGAWRKRVLKEKN